MRKYTQRELLEENYLTRAGSFINRNIIKNISPTAAGYISKIPTSGTSPKQAADAAIKILTKSGQIEKSYFRYKISPQEVNSEIITPARSARRSRPGGTSSSPFDLTAANYLYFKYMVYRPNIGVRDIAIKLAEVKGKGWTATAVIELEQTAAPAPTPATPAP